MNMYSDKHYPKAPITEAVIDLRVELSPDVSVAELKRVHAEQEVAYPTIEELNENIGQMQFAPQANAAASTKHVGFRFKSEDGKQIHQVRLDGFTMNRLAPYQNWNSFRTEARRLWDIYRSVAKPSKIIRVAVRYINRIEIPLPMKDFRDYLRTVPEVSPDLPQELSSYFMQLVIPQDDVKSLALINETIIELTEKVVSVVLDIDISRTEDLPSEEDSVWELFEKLHLEKNKVFEACITDKARELFQ